MPGLWDLLLMGMRRSKVRVKAEITAREVFSAENDLAGVSGEMLDHMINCLEHRHFVALDLCGLNQAFRRKLANNGNCIACFPAQEFLELSCLNHGAPGKFQITLANIGPAAHTEANPLADVAAEMKYKVADGVLVLSAAEPDLFTAEFIEAVADSIGQLPQFCTRVIDERSVPTARH